MDSSSAIQALKIKLRDYLMAKGVNVPVVGKFSCPLPDCIHLHGDRHPSAGFVPGSNETLVHCFASNKTYDIFHMFAKEHDLPLEGSGFYIETLPALAKHMGVVYDVENLSEDQKQIYRKLKAYRDAANIITTYPNPNAEAKLAIRNWTVQTAKECLVGAVESFDNHIARMVAKGWPVEYLESIELANVNIFNEDNLIFVVCNSIGEPIGFVARDFKYAEKGSDAPKFRNSHTSDIYRKGEVLYNFSNCRNHSICAPIFVFEGYGDCVSAWQAGLKNSCAVGATAFTKQHLAVLATSNAMEYIIVMDGDAKGIEAANRIVDEFCNEGLNLSVKFIEIPDNMDGDDYIKAHGIEAFKQLKVYTAFEWSLKYSKIKDPDKLVPASIDKIMHEQDRVKRYFFAKILAETTEVPIKFILDEIEHRTNLTDSEKEKRLSFFSTDVITRLRRGEPLKPILSETLDRLAELDKSFGENRKGINETYSLDITSVRKRLLDGVEESGFNFGSIIPNAGPAQPIFPRMQKLLDGLPRHGSFIMLGGYPAAGKTSFLRYLMFNIALANPDVRIIFMSIDDNKSKILQSVVAISQNLSLTAVRMPKKLNDEELNRWNLGWKLLDEVKDRFVILDTNDGSTLDDMERYIRTSQVEYPNHQVIVVLDNFHKLTDYMGMDQKTKNCACSERIKRFTTQFNIPIICTLELRKPAQGGLVKPTYFELKDTIQLAYDADYIWMLNNALQSDPESNMHWLDDEDSDILSQTRRPKPIIELDIVKNKETEFKGSIFFKFKDNKSQFFEMTQEEESILKTRPKRKQSDGDFKFGI